MESTSRRVLLKVSGEFLAGASKIGVDYDVIQNLSGVIKRVLDLDIELGVVVGGGNFCRGRSSRFMNRIHADHMGMMATVMNALVLSDALEKIDVKTAILTSIHFPQVGELYSPAKANSYLREKKVVIFGYGTGSAFFSTDTAASLRASEIGADVILKATTGTDGVYTDDPKINPEAKKYTSLTFDEMLAKNLKVIDSTAASMCRDNKISILIFNISPPENILHVLKDPSIGTTVTL